METKKMKFNWDKNIELPLNKEDMTNEERIRFIASTMLSHMADGFDTILKAGFSAYEIPYGLFLCSIPPEFTETKKQEDDFIKLASKQFKDITNSNTGPDEDQVKLQFDYSRLRNELYNHIAKSTINMINRIFPDNYEHMKATKEARIRMENARIEKQLVVKYLYYNKKTTSLDKSQVDRIIETWENSVNRTTEQLKLKYETQIDTLKTDYKTITEQIPRIEFLVKYISLVENQLKKSESLSDIYKKLNHAEKNVLKIKNKDKAKAPKTAKPAKNIEQLKAEESFIDLSDFI